MEAGAIGDDGARFVARHEPRSGVVLLQVEICDGDIAHGYLVRLIGHGHVYAVEAVRSGLRGDETHIRRIAEDTGSVYAAGDDSCAAVR